MAYRKSSSQLFSLRLAHLQFSFVKMLYNLSIQTILLLVQMLLHQITSSLWLQKQSALGLSVLGLKAVHQYSLALHL